MKEEAQDSRGWLLLIHHIPPKPAYLRVKVRRRLQRLGAVAIKNSVYALPMGEAALEDLQWVAREVMDSGGEATVCEARLLEGLTDAAVEALFQAARDADYAQVAQEARELNRLPRSVKSGESLSALTAGVARLRSRLEEVARIDFFSAPGLVAAEGLVAALEKRVAQWAAPSTGSDREEPVPSARGCTWVTRRGIYVDRMASAWLIRRFIDPEARFLFVPGKSYRPKAGELRFDMFEGEYTHEGELCTFEVLLKRFQLKDRALMALAELIHDIDLKDAKYGRLETHGFELMLAGIAMSHARDEDRLARASALLDDLYTYFTRKEPPRF